MFERESLFVFTQYKPGSFSLEKGKRMIFPVLIQ